MQGIPLEPLVILVLIFAVICVAHLVRRAQARRESAGGTKHRIPAQVLPAAPVLPSALLKAPPPTASKPRKIVIPSEGSDRVYEYDLSSPFWADVAKMQPGSFVKYESLDKDWHVFTVVDGPKYGRRDFDGGIGLSVVVRRVSTGRVFTMPPKRLRSCEPAFARRDGTNVKPGEGGWR